MQRNRFVRGITSAFFCVVLTTLVACNSSAPTAITSPNNQATIAPPDKQILHRVTEGGDFNTLDPALTLGPGDPINTLFTGLVGLNDNGTVSDQLAASHHVSSDGLTYTFTLKPNLKFSDGTSLTAEDVAYSINRAVIPATKSPVARYLSLIKDFDKVNAGKQASLIGDSVVVKDPNTIALMLSKPAAYFLAALTYPTSYVVEKKLIERYGEQWTDHLDQGGGDGPFKVQSYEHTSNLTLVPNPNFEGLKPRLQKIIWTIGSDRDSNYKAYLAGQYDVVGIPPSQGAAVASKPDFRRAPALAFRYIGMNYLSQPFDNSKVRQAFALAINKDLIINHVINIAIKAVTPSNHIIPDGLLGYNPTLTGPAGVASTTGDQTKARQLLQQGLQEDGYASVAALPPLSLAYDISYKAGANTMLAVADEWKQILGVTVKLVGMQPNDLIHAEVSTIGNSRLQMFYGVWGASYPDPQNFTTLFFGKHSDYNFFNYGQNNSTSAKAQQAVQDELARADIEQDSTKRLSMYQDAEQHIVNDVGIIPLYQTAYVVAINHKLQNYKLTSLGLLATNDWANIYFVQ